MARFLDDQGRIPAHIDTQLKNCHDRYSVLLTLCNNAKMRALSDKSDRFLRDHGIAISSRRQREKSIEDYFEGVFQQITDDAFVALTATFERIVFAKAGNATGLARKIVRENYGKNPFDIAISSFVKDSDDIHNLSAVHHMLQGKIPNDLSHDLGKIISYRNRVTHGKRFGEETTISLQNVLETLSKILKIIG